MKVQELGAFEAKTHLSRLLDAVEKGEKIYITRRGKRVAQLSAAEEPKKAKFGCAKSQNFYMSPDFDEPLEDFKEYM
jgi:prevent-host-death family protein